jgi:Single-strand binding protein family
MAADNHTTIVGNLVEDPEVRFTQNGIAVTNLRVAVTQRVQQDGQWRDGDTSFFKVNVWRDQAEHLADSLGKGDRVMVTGRLRQRSWETPEGDKRSVTASTEWGRWPLVRRSLRSGELAYYVCTGPAGLPLVALVQRIRHPARADPAHLQPGQPPVRRPGRPAAGHLAHRLRWSLWRRRHQARARTCHYRRQATWDP